MNRILLSSVATIALSVAAGSAASAADLSRVPPPVFATSDILNANNQVTVDITATDYDYKESNPNAGQVPAIVPGAFPPGIYSGSVLDSEKGWALPGVTVSSSVMTDLLGIHNVYIYTSSSMLNAHTNYWSSAVTNKDNAAINDSDLRIGKGFDISNNVMLTPYIGAGTHLWSRNLSAAEGYHENYSNDYVGGGLLFQFSPLSRLVLSANGLIGTTFNAGMSTTRDSGAYPYLVPETFKLGSSVIYMAGASADYAITDRIHANIGVDYVDFKYGQSARNLSGLLEPNSHTQNVTVKAGLGYSFGDDIGHTSSVIASSPVAFTWTGLYTGASVGGVWANSSASPFCLNDAGMLNGPGCFGFSQSGRLDSHASGLMLGSQIGYNLQIGSIVAGVEADLQDTPVTAGAEQADTTPNHGQNEVSSRLNYLGTARVRLGMLMGDGTLVYATGGLAYGAGTVGSTHGYSASYPNYALDPNYTSVLFPQSNSFGRAGWTFGGGLEHALSASWSAKLEGLYYDLGSVTVGAGDVLNPSDDRVFGYKFKETGALVRVGLNYKFGDALSSVFGGH